MTSTAHHAPTAVDVTQLNYPDHAPVDLAQAAGATAQHNTDLRKPDRALEFDSSEHHGARPKIYPARFIFPTDEQREQFEETDGAHASAHPPVAPFLRPPLFQFYATYTSPRRSSAELFRGQARRTQDIQPHPQPGPRDSDSEAEHAVQLIGFRTRQDSNSQTSEGEGQQGHAPRNRTNTSEGHISDHSGDTSDHRGDSSDSTDHSDTDSFLTDDDHRDIMANNRLLAAVATRPELFDGKKPEKAQQWWNSVDRYAAFSEIAGEHKARLVGMMFKGIALHWYEGLPAATQTDINLLTQAFRAKFIEPGPNMLQQQIAALSKQQQADESVEEYAAEARTRLANLGYNPNQQLTMIINGFRPDIKSVVLQHMPFDDVNALINKAKHVEQALKCYVSGKITTKAEDNKNDDVKSAIDKLTANVTAMQRAAETRASPNRGRGRGQQQRPPRGAPAEKRCYICNSPHHLKRDCNRSQQQVRPCCYTCGSDRHFRRDCPQEHPNQRGNGRFNRGQFTGRGYGRGFNNQGIQRGARRFNNRGAGRGYAGQGFHNPGPNPGAYNQWEN